MWADAALRPNPDGWGYFVRDKVNDVGYRSICAPGTVRALSTMLARWGTLSWEEAIAPAARIAQEGFAVSAHLAAGWQGKPAYPEAASLLERVWSNAEARRIYQQAMAAGQMGEVPVGAVIVDGDHKVIAGDHNRTISCCDPSAHAEINVLRAAAQRLQNYRLLSTKLYVTIEPCVMCMGAIVHARV